MKKIAAIICIFAALLTLCACSDNSPVEGEENIKTEGQIISEGKYFSLTALTDDKGNTKYSYEIKSEDGEVMENALCAEQPRIAQINDDLIGIRFTSDGHSFSRYYDIKNGVISDSVKNAFWDNGVLVASNEYDNGHYFIVQSIFGDEVYLRTDVESSSWQITVIAAELSEDGSTLSVGYVNGDGSNADAKVSTVKLDLTAAEEETEG